MNTYEMALIAHRLVEWMKYHYMAFDIDLPVDEVEEELARYEVFASLSQDYQKIAMRDLSAWAEHAEMNEMVRIYGESI